MVHLLAPALPEVVDNSAGESAMKERFGALPLSYAGANSRGRIRTCDHPLHRRSNPHLHHRPKPQGLKPRFKSSAYPALKDPLFHSSTDIQVITNIQVHHECSTHRETSAGERTKRESTRGWFLRQPCASGIRPQILADPGVTVDQHLGRVRLPCSRRRHWSEVSLLFTTGETCVTQSKNTTSRIACDSCSVLLTTSCHPPKRIVA